MRDNMDELKDKNSSDFVNPVHINQVPQAASKLHAENTIKNNSPQANKKPDEEEQYSLNDDRRVKVLSPGAMVVKRFFRNSLAVTGLAILIFMFLFSFLGGVISPYAEDEKFYRYDMQNKEYAGVTVNAESRFAAADGAEFNSIIQAQMVLAMQQNKDMFTYRDVEYEVAKEGEDFYSIATGGKMIGIAYKDIINSSVQDASISFELQYNALKAYANRENSFSTDGTDYTIDKDGGVFAGSEEIAYISRYVVQSVMPDIFITRGFKEELAETIDGGGNEFVFTDENGETHEYTIKYDDKTKSWSVLQATETRVFDTYSSPSKEHWLGTDRNGMDMLTRIMYGGRVSLLIGFIVVAIETVLGVILGGISGYFGKWIDNLIMRIVDIFYCIPSTPIIIILGAVMDGMRVDPQIRMLYLMLILGFLGWPSVARMVRGQILSLREQEFMTAAEAGGIRVSRRIFRHLIPNVIPQLIVVCTMGLGSTIITESTLSFLGLGVKFPFASWGNIINDITDTYVLTTYWFIWIPAGVCLLLTVLAFNLVGDGLRDAFDPKMKR